MGAMPNEPSMEEILSSIKRIIAEEDVASPSLPRAPRRSSPSAPPAAAETLAADEFVDDDQILELTDALPGDDHAESAQEEPVMTAPANPAPATPQTAAKTESKPAKPARAKTPAAPSPERAPERAPESAPEPASGPGVMSDMSAEAARESLVNLSKLLIRPDDGQSNTLENLVREMLRPMLKEWLDAKLPGLVQGMVKREIDRITGRV